MTKRRALRKSAYKLDDILRRIMTAIAYILLLPCLIGMIIFFILADYPRMVSCALILVVCIHLNKSI